MSSNVLETDQIMLMAESSQVKLTFIYIELFTTEFQNHFTVITGKKCNKIPS